MSNYTLTYRKDKSQEIFIEGVKEENGIISHDLHDANLYFRREYEDALSIIDFIVRNQQLYVGDIKRQNVVYPRINNRILFTGQRGCGKTSVMLSLANYLENGKEKYIKNEQGKKISFETECVFHCLPMVDPSHFDNNNNILLTVITSMFSEAKKKMNEDGDKSDTAYREDLLKQFEKVFKSLDSIKSELSSYTLESLNRKSDAEDLRDKMNDLVGKYLKFLDTGKNSRLVLLIDDIDMSVSHAPEMLEQLRKYLELDNLIILMSANLGQLSNEMREKYSSAFQYTLKDSNQALSIDVEDLATKYLLKLFPTSRRINVERLDSQLLETDLQGVINAEATDRDKPQGNFQKVILSLIWTKTRLLFIPKDPENTLHPIIPTNLRDLAQFLDMLTALQDVESVKKDKKGNVENVLFASKKDYDECEHNLQVFKNYVMKTWIPNHLKVDEELVFHNIPSDITEINKHLINSINVIGTKHKEDLMSRQVGLDIIEKNADNVFIDRDIYTMVSPNDPKFVKANKISDIFNQPSNYSYGDLLLMIDKYETYFESEEHRRFTDAIKIYYSILLFETMFFKSQKVNYDYKDGKEYAVIPIQRLIGGNVYYPNYFEIITDENFNQKGPSFDAKRAFYHKVKVDKRNKVGEKYPLFAVLYYGDIRPDRYEKDHIYDTTFSKNAEIDGVNYVTFDILSILNNMLNPCHTLSRLDSVEFRPKEERWEKIVDSIREWGENNKIDGKCVPNAILPFYAVDVMLTYLRHDYSTDDLFIVSKEEKPNTINAKNATNSINFFFNDSASIMVEIMSHLKLILKIKKDEALSNPEKKMLKKIAANLMRIKGKNIKINLETLSDAEKETLNEIAANMTRGKDKNIIEKIAKKNKGTLSEAEKATLNEIEGKYLTFIEYVAKYLVNVEDKNKIEEIAKKKEALSEDDIKILKDIATREWIVVADKDKLEEIAKKKEALLENEKEILNDIASKMCITDNDKLIKDICYAMFETDADNMMLLIENLEIIMEAHKCYYELSLGKNCEKLDHKDTVIDLYRNHVIALILGKSLITKKEKESFIKELREFSSISEIYKNLIEVMWENKIKEICIRGQIQEKVRSFKVVDAYYGKLWEETTKLFELIDSVDTAVKPISVYKSLYEESKKLFLKQ